MKIHYRPHLKVLARYLRNNSTLGEVLLWNEIKARKMHGYQFMRQKPILNYIVAFYCAKLKLMIEVDGSSHDHPDAYANDIVRQEEIEALGLNFIRFDDHDVKQNMSSVLRTLEDYILRCEGGQK